MDATESRWLYSSSSSDKAFRLPGAEIVLEVKLGRALVRGVEAVVVKLEDEGGFGRVEDLVVVRSGSKVTPSMDIVCRQNACCCCYLL